MYTGMHAGYLVQHAVEMPVEEAKRIADFGGEDGWMCVMVIRGDVCV